MTALLAMVAFAVDVGVLYISRTELQRTADAAAMAACWELVNVPATAKGDGSNKKLASNARRKAQEFVALNQTQQKSLTLSADDVSVGYLARPADPSSQIQEGKQAPPNAVSVLVQRTRQRNNEVPLFFARVLGIDQASVSAEATAVLNSKFKGFRTPPDGDNLPILPFALGNSAWNDLIRGQGQDEYCWDADKKRVVLGSDGIQEVRLYPNATGSSGNYGTVDIGASNNSTPDIARQITDGISQSDLDHLGGSLEFNGDGRLYLNADPGISAGFKDELASIVGQTRAVPIYSEIEGSGGRATYTIVKFVGVRLMHVDFAGADKQVIVQPAAIVIRGGIEGDSNDRTDFIFSPVRLVR